MNRNTQYLIIAVLVLVVVVLGFYIYRQEHRPDGVEMKIDDKGISIQQN